VQEQQFADVMRYVYRIFHSQVFKSSQRKKTDTLVFLNCVLMFSKQAD
jgi:hypothetical protein